MASLWLLLRWVQLLLHVGVLLGHMWGGGGAWPAHVSCCRAPPAFWGKLQHLTCCILVPTSPCEAVGYSTCCASATTGGCTACLERGELQATAVCACMRRKDRTMKDLTLQRMFGSAGTTETPVSASQRPIISWPNLPHHNSDGQVSQNLSGHLKRTHLEF